MPFHKDVRVMRRRTRFEPFEERVALSVQPLDILPPETGIDQPVEQAEAELPSPHGDFRLANAPDYAVSYDLAFVEPLLADVGQFTGAQYVHAKYGFTGQGQTVAIIDSGIAYDHMSLGGGFGKGHRVVGGYDFAENDADPYDDGPAGFHGTHVAGIVGSDHTLHRGVAPGIDLVALRVFDDNGSGYFSWVARALDWVHEHRNDFANPITTVNMSLGTNWNADSIPSWTTLEDELAQLELDGIFVAVSAGNAFQDYGAAGFSYPAASPYVVPVTSVDDDGALSSFSQRSDGVLAAPGRSIMSTVPDHIFGSDGTPNDFGAASGTSMAAPQVAGASAIVRQAMRLLGREQVVQDLIFDHLQRTSDVAFDAVTNVHYHRINLRTAIDSLMPVDDFGSTVDDAADLGTLSGQHVVEGLIGTVDDRDYFRFKASADGTVAVQLTSTHDLDPNLDIAGSHVEIQGDKATFDVVAGQQYAFSLGTNRGLGFYDVTLQLDAMTTVKRVVASSGLVFTLDDTGWLSVNGAPKWNHTRDFAVSDEGSLYWLGTNGELRQRCTDGIWYTFARGVTKFAVRDDGTVYSLDKHDWLSVNGRRLWGHTRDFTLASNQTLYRLRTNGLLQELQEGGSWRTIGQNVVEFAVRDDGTMSLDTDGCQNVQGRKAWSRAHDLVVTRDENLHCSGGLDSAQEMHSWRTSDPDILEFTVRREAMNRSFVGDGMPSAAGNGIWTGTCHPPEHAAGTPVSGEQEGAPNAIRGQLPTHPEPRRCEPVVTKTRPPAWTTPIDGVTERVAAVDWLFEDADTVLAATLAI